MNMKSLLVVGGTGVISYAVVQEALKQNYKVTCINRGKSKNQTISSEVELIIADYHDGSIIKSKLEGRHFDAVLDILCFSEKDIEYSISLFKDHCSQYLFFSSAEAYNKPKYKDIAYNENAELSNPLWAYSVNKAKCEKKLIELASKLSLTYTIIRPAITYGNTRIPYGLMPPYGYHGTIIQRIIHNKPILLWDGGKAIATITRVEDFAIGLVGLLGNPKAYNQAFHIVGDDAYSWKDVIDTLGSILDKEPIYCDVPCEFLADELVDYKEQLLGGRAISQRLDNSKLKSVVPNFKAKIHLKEGIQMTVNYYQRNHYLSGIDWAFDANMDRLVRKWCNKNKIDVTKYNLSFIDYLGNVTVRDRFLYFLELHKDNFFVGIIKKVRSFILFSLR